MKRGPIGWILAAWRFVVDVALRWYHGRVGDLAASVTFWILISLPASVLALLAMLDPLERLISILFSTQLDEARLEEEVVTFIGQVFTDESGVIRRTIESLFDQSNSGLFIISVGLAIWSISRGFAGLIRALEDIYDIEERRAWYHTRVVAVVLGIGSMLVPIPLMLIDQLVWGRIEDGSAETAVRTFVAVLVLILWASVLFHFGPAKRYRWRFDLPGAVVAAVLWWMMTIGFTWYVRRTSGVTSAVGTAILALTWIWMAAQVLLIGGAVNFLFGERLGVRRGRRPWALPEMVRNGTDEIKKIVVSDRSTTPAETAELPQVPNVPRSSDGASGGSAA